MLILDGFRFPFQMERIRDYVKEILFNHWNCVELGFV